MRIDAERLVRSKRDIYLDLLVRPTQVASEPSLVERSAIVLRDARADHPEPRFAFWPPVPWRDGVMLRIRFTGPRRAQLVDLLVWMAQHPMLREVEGEIVALPSRQSGVDKPWIRGVSAGLRVAGRDLVPIATYPPASLPHDLLTTVLDWAMVDRAARVWISIWNRDRRVGSTELRDQLESALLWTSDVAVVTWDGDTFRRVVFNRDCVMATVSCSDQLRPSENDARRRAEAVDRFADLLLRCRHQLSYAAVKATGMLVPGWDFFIPSTPTPPFGTEWQPFLDPPADTVPDVFAMQLLTPDHRAKLAGSYWREQITSDGYRLIRARDLEGWLPGPGVAVEARTRQEGRAAFANLLLRPNAE